MKTYWLCIALLILSIKYSLGEIKNGYANGINSARVSLKTLYALLNDHTMTGGQKKAINAKVKEVVKYITAYELTQNLLNQFRIIAPQLYNEIDSIKDKKGRITDVYIKFIPEEQALVQAWGITGIDQVSGDPDAYQSEYGERTVSVKVWIVSKSLVVLAHELGHIKYVVPNMAQYVEYHVRNYRPGTTESNHVGHNPSDASGESALTFERKFRESYASYLKNGRDQTDSPRVLADKIRREVMSRAQTVDRLASL